MTIDIKEAPHSRRDAPAAVPKTMRAAATDRFGGPEVLKVLEVPVPELEPGEVLIEVNTAGVGGWDADMREGWWPSGHPKLPLILGTDGSGTIAAVGSRVRRFHRGEAVYAYSFANPKGGFYAEYTTVSADKVAPVPDALNMRDAGAIPATGLTALQGIDDALGVRKGETILILGGSGGVGTPAVQFAKLRGARVLATGSGSDGAALVRKLGADEAIDGRQEDLCAAVRRLAPDGVDGVLALGGTEALAQCTDVVRSGGRIAYPNGVEPAPAKHRGVRVIPYDAVAGAREFARLDRAVTAAKLRVVIAAEYRLDEAAKAHQRLAEGHVLGKIVLRIHR
jgi:NADPH:quinone reductase-like Zn-dependent oxidoreductase